jgi:hypothetical protein
MTACDSEPADPETVHPAAAFLVAGAPAAGDQTLFAVVMEAYRHGVSTLKVGDLVQARVLPRAVPKSRICAD